MSSSRRSPKAWRVLGGALVVAADAAFRLGDWAVADAATLEAIRVSQDTGQGIWYGYALSIRTRLAAAHGLEDEAARLGQDAVALAESAGARTGLRFARAALG